MTSVFGSLPFRVLSILMPAPTAVLFIWVGAGNILALKSGGDLVALARLLETAPSGHTSAVNRELLERIGLAPQFDDLNHSCIDEISRSAVTVRLALLETGRGTDSAAQLSERGKMATRAVDQRLACMPFDGNAWYYRARLLDEFGDDPKNVATSAPDFLSIRTIRKVDHGASFRVRGTKDRGWRRNCVVRIYE